MSLYDRFAAPEPECTDEEWDAAREHLVADWMDRGWDRADAEGHIDDLMVWDQVDADRADAESVRADEVYARLKEES